MTKTEKAIKICDSLIERLVKTRDALIEESATEELNKSIAPGWTSKVNKDTNVINFSHGNHGMVSVFRNPKTNMFEVKHNGGYAGIMGQKGVFEKPAEALAHANSYMAGLNSGKLATRPLVNIPSSESMNLKPKPVEPNMAPLKPITSGINVAQAPKMPVGFKKSKEHTAAQLAAIEEAERLKKKANSSLWNKHSSVPNADVEVARLKKNNPTAVGEDAMANQLANMMNGKSMLNPDHRQPTAEDMIMAGERMGIGANPELIKAADQQWGGALNNWLAEACKPISSRFTSPEEEEAYWASIKVADKDDRGPGY